ncbi:MAG: L,D-transpeptidase [Minisyncoccales bacterium]
MKVRKKIAFFAFLIFIFPSTLKTNEKKEIDMVYGEKLCANYLEYECYTVGKKIIRVQTNQGMREQLVTEKWADLFPNPEKRDFIQRINRQNTELEFGQKIAIPRQIEGKSYLDFSPFPHSVCFYDLENGVCFLAKDYADNERSEKNLNWQMPCVEGKTIVFDPRLLAFAAYNQTGQLVYWGPAVGGRKICSDIKKPCQTPQGQFKIVYKTGAHYRSRSYPVGCHGKECAAMPYALFFEDGAAFHASNGLPGKNASHGCVRLFEKDAQWLNQEFAEIGTKVIINPY